MGYREARQLARLRHELRQRLLTHTSEGTARVLNEFRSAAARYEAESPELRGEYERWKVRFELLLNGAPRQN